MASNLSLMVFTTAAIAFATSALERIEDLRQTSRHVRKVPKPEVEAVVLPIRQPPDWIVLARLTLLQLSRA